jgi:mannosyl-oligosaccharide alpha-1,2-mannosidase
MFVMGLKEEFQTARDWIDQHLSAKIANGGSVSFFETTIRILGGLMSASDLTGVPFSFRRPKSWLNA